MSLRIGIVADFNTENFVRIIEKQCAGMDATVTAAPYGQALQTLLTPTAEFWERPYDLLVIWTFPDAVSANFNDLLDFHSRAAEDLHRDVDAFAGVVRGLGQRAHNIFLPSWIVPPGRSPRPSVEMKHGVGATAALLQMNLRLVETLGVDPRVVLFNTDRWLRTGGAGAFSDKLWYLSKTPFSKAVFDDAAKDMIATLRGVKGQRKKVVILDLDNTLWGGIVGDVGWEGVQLGGHDPVGEAFAQFQRELKRLSQEGVVLALVSKNEESAALDAIEQHPEMLLRSGDFAGWRINWNDKAENIVDLMADLNLGVDSAVFIDDSPHERSRVRQALPDVLVPEWPSDPMDYARALRELRCFEDPGLSSEDRSRTAMYVSDRQRKQLQTDLGSLDKWLETLGLEVRVEPLSPTNLERTSQLLNKTNQMNLTTRRMSAQELSDWASLENHRLWTFRVVDKIGDYGVCGIASVAFCDSRANLVDFVLSCRAMGRGVEDAIISVVADRAREAGARQLVAAYVPTKKNKPCQRWFEQHSGFAPADGTQTFLLDLARDIAAPTHIRITAGAA